MRRRAKPAKSKVKGKLPATRKSLKSESSRVSDLERRLAESLEREKATSRALTKALEQQTATSEILRVISSSPTDVQRVLDAVAENAARLCDAEDASILKEDGGVIHVVANRGASRLRDFEGTSASRGSVAGRAILDGQLVHVHDITEASEAEFPVSKALARHFGHRTMLATPLLREGAPIGAIFVRRTQVWPFSDKQIELLRTFADQAVIAIENVRLFNELQDKTHVASEAHAQVSEALARETATSEILRVIGSSLTDAQPVFESIARSGLTVCAALGCVVFVVDGDMLRVAATAGVRPERVERFRRDYPISLSADIDTAQAVRERRMVHLADIVNNPNATANDVEVARLAGYRTRLMVPMVRGDRALGLIAVTREDSAAFPAQLVELLRTFADQAVIAIENVRLFNELEARNAEQTDTLARQMATGEVLRAISRAQTDAQPVFDIIATSARRLCGANYGQVQLYEGELIRLAALDNVDPEGAEAIRHAYPLRVGEGNLGGRVIERRAVVQIPDLLEDGAYQYKSTWEASGLRSLLGVPMLRDGEPIGAIAVGRLETGLFPDKEVELLQTFADQAVIAIENVRLFTELQASNRELTTALEQQTATSDILRVISQSQTDVQPVFDAIVASAVRLLGADAGSLTRVAGDQIELAAFTSTDDTGDSAVRAGFPLSLHSEGGNAQVIRDRAPLNIADAQTDPRMRETMRAAARVRGSRSRAVVPLLRHDEAIGTISVSRREPGGFTDDEIALLKTFADQAVIAIENVRLFNELEGRNRDLTATAEILRVISSSPTDVQPVFDTIVQAARALCGADSAAALSYDGEQLQIESLDNPNRERADALRQVYPMPANRGHATGRAILTGRPVHIPDVREDPEYALDALRDTVDLRSVASVPMVRDGAPIGAITVQWWTTPRSFSDKQISLLQTFADQAVIAVENVRLFKELEVRNRDLTESLEQQTATSRILSVISSSPTDVEPVFRTILASTNRLCEASFSVLWLWDGEALTAAASGNVSPSLAERLRTARVRPREGGSPVALTALEHSVVHVADVLADSRFSPANVPAYWIEGARSIVSVPMLREGNLVGVINTWRLEPMAFTDKQIELLKTFADQAVIAIENVRLFTELEGRNRDLTATSEILRVISSSPTDVEPVFDTIIRSAVRLCDGLYGSAIRFDGEMMHLAAGYNYTPEVRQALEEAFPMRPHRRMMAGRAILSRTVIQVEDALEDSEYAQDVARAGGFRSMLAVPMMREGNPIGAIVVNRGQPGSFSVNQIDLLKTFADQAVIAVENVRLFKELEARTGELTQSVEKLTALGEVSRAVSSTLDVETVLDTIVSRASQLAGADGCAIYEYDDATEAFHIRATHNLDPILVETLRAAPLRKGEGAMGRAAETREPTQVADIAAPGAYQSHIRDTLLGAGYRALLSVPLLREGEIIGSLSLNRHAPGEFPPEAVEVLKTFATQSALAIQNARLFREIADKSAQLEAASRHKSEFLANMSHELRTPLNAIIGFSEVLVDRMFGELTEKQDEYLKDIYASGQHLLSLINDILDLSKIEAGRMELEVADFDLPSAIDNALILVRERASRRGITLGHSVDDRLGQIRGDERKLKQVLLNLLSNALKFTPEGGRIDVHAVPHDGAAEISVADTGVGIAPEDQEAVFEEFRQVGTADKKVEGTGLGLALSRKFIELHGGKIWVTSAVGVGSTFTFTLPVRRGE